MPFTLTVRRKEMDNQVKPYTKELALSSSWFDKFMLEFNRELNIFKERTSSQQMSKGPT